MNIYKLGEIPIETYPNIGGKARGLDMLIKKGFNVPCGFVITEIDNLNEDEIYSLFDEMNMETVSVRSSATLEDGNNYSSAGQFETYLFVKRDELISSINKCVSSLDSDRVREYMQHFDIKTHNAMNVVVQKMVDSIQAGVLFTQDPMAADMMLIEAVSGQGENLVSGKVESNRYQISRYKFNSLGDELLSKEKLENIYNVGSEIRSSFGCEMDVEWAYTDELYLLQMRPITVEMPNLTEFDRCDNLDGLLFTKRNVGEMMPGAVTPLTLSTSAKAIDYGMRYMLKYAGVYKTIDDVPSMHLISSFSNQLFFDMKLLYDMYKRVGIADPQQMNLSIMGEYYDYPKVEGKFSNGFVRTIGTVKFLKFVLSGNKSKKKIDDLISKMTFIDDGSSAKEIYDDITDNLKYLDECLIYHYSASSYSGSSMSTLYQMIESYFDDKNKYQVFMADILSNIEGIESADILYMLQNISNDIKKINPDMIKANEDDLLSFIKEHDEINKQYKKFLEKHGHRSIKEAEMRSKSWKRDEKHLMKYLLSIMNSKGDMKQGNDSVDLKEKFSFVDKPLLKKMAIIYAKKSREAVVDREYTKSRMIKMVDLFKERYIILAQKMVSLNIIPDEDLIYFFLHDEIGNLLNGDKELVKKAEMRRKALDYQENLVFDDVYIGRPIPIVDMDENRKNENVGISISKGKTKGKVKIVKTESDAKKLEKGDIMVAKITDIGWTPYYSIISGLITEIGSSLSHGAVVAREYGLPTIVNVKNATNIYKDGDYIELDATLGQITILNKEA